VLIPTAEIESWGLCRQAPLAPLYTFPGLCENCLGDGFGTLPRQWPSAVLIMNTVRFGQKCSASVMEAQLVMCNMACLHSKGDASNSTLFGQSLGQRQITCVSRLMEVSSRDFRAAFVVDPRGLVPIAVQASRR